MSDSAKALLSKAVLIVDDNYSIRSALRIFFEQRTELSVCGEAADGMEAIRKAEELHPGLVIMDLSMPNMNGMQAAWAIRQAMPEARIIVFTLYSDRVSKAVAARSGVDLIVSKTEGSAGLLKALSPLLERDKPLS
jgi:DNA-binding NarL/FixJ family response regulator